MQWFTEILESDQEQDAEDGEDDELGFPATRGRRAVVSENSTDEDNCHEEPVGEIVGHRL